AGHRASARPLPGPGSCSHADARSGPVVRRLKLIGLACLAAAVLPLGAWGAGGGTGVELTEAGGATFPERAFVLSLPGDRSLTANDVDVSENGQSVVDLSVTPASAAGGTTFGAVVVVDAGGSVHGGPMEAVVVGARGFA